jgi:hypothetical protein
MQCRLLRRHGAIDNPDGRSSLSRFDLTFSNVTNGDSVGFSLTFLKTTAGKGVVLVRRSRIRLNAGFSPKLLPPVTLSGSVRQPRTSRMNLN